MGNRSGERWYVECTHRVMLRRLRLAFFPLTLALTSALGCSTASEEAPDDDIAALEEGPSAPAPPCRAWSPLGDAVAKAAADGESTTSHLFSYQNRLLQGPIVGGEAYADAMTKLIQSAKREVIFEVFILEDGWLTGRLRDAIATLPADLPVYVLVSADRTVDRTDPSGDPARPPSATQVTADRVLKLLDPAHTHNVIVGGWHVSGAFGNGINHDKTIVVDRERTIVSNINLELPSDPSRFNPATGQTWYQMAVELEGEVAQSVAFEATTAWEHVTAVASSHGNIKDGRNEKGVFALPALAPNAAAPAGACLPIVALGRELGTEDEAAANSGLIALFKNAKREVHMISPNLNAISALAALSDATKQSDVYIVLSKGFTEKLESLPGQGGGNEEVVREHLPGMMEGRGGNPCKMHVRWYARPDNPSVAVYAETEGASHAKYASADGQVVVVGSQNMDTQSWEVSREFSVAIDDAPTTAKFDEEWRRVWDRGECAFECGGCPTTN